MKMMFAWIEKYKVLFLIIGLSVLDATHVINLSTGVWIGLGLFGFGDIHSKESQIASDLQTDISDMKHTISDIMGLIKNSSASASK
jgi:hypothetical protein